MVVSTRQKYADAEIRKRKYQEQDGVVQFDVTRIWCGIRNVNSNEKYLRESKLIALVMNEWKCMWEREKKARSSVDKVMHINLPCTVERGWNMEFWMQGYL
jgi:hypothetical protein